MNLSKAKLINMTPHPLNFFRAGDVYRRGPKLYLLDPSTLPYLILDPPSPPKPVRLVGEYEPQGFADGIPVFRNVITDITNLPEPDAGSLYIVSKPAAETLWATGRTADILCPVDVIYMTETRVIGCTGLRCADVRVY